MEEFCSSIEPHPPKPNRDSHTHLSCVQTVVAQSLVLKERTSRERVWWPQASQILFWETEVWTDAPAGPAVWSWQRSPSWCTGWRGPARGPACPPVSRSRSQCSGVGDRSTAGTFSPSLTDGADPGTRTRIRPKQIHFIFIFLWFTIIGSMYNKNNNSA